MESCAEQYHALARLYFSAPSLLPHSLLTVALEDRKCSHTRLLRILEREVRSDLLMSRSSPAQLPCHVQQWQCGQAQRGHLNES